MQAMEKNLHYGEQGQFVSVDDFMVSFDPKAFTVPMFAQLLPDIGLDYTVYPNFGKTVPYIRMDRLDTILLSRASVNSERTIKESGQLRYLMMDNNVGCAFVEGDKWYRIDFTTYNGDLLGISCSCGSEDVCNHALAVACAMQKLEGARVFWYRKQQYCAVDHLYFRCIYPSHKQRSGNMHCEWKNCFQPWILERGRRYFEEGCVSQIIQYGNRIVANVEGTEDYCVEIDLPGGVPDSWLCTCPYAVKDNCKHKAAVLFAIEAGEYTFTGEPPEYEADIPIEEILPWREAIENLPADTLRRFLLDYADRNDEIREYLSIWYLHGLPEGLLEQWKAKLQDYASAKAAGRRYVPEDEVYYFLCGVRNALYNRLLLLRKVGATMDAFYWLGTAFEIASKKVYADEEGEFRDFYYDCVKDWYLLLSEATEEQHTQMQEWFWEHRAAFFAHAAGATEVAFLYFPWSEELERKNFEIVDELIANCRSDKELGLLMDCRIEIMCFLGCSKEEEWDFWKKHLDYDYARHCLLEDYYMESEDRVHIVPLLKQLKEMDSNNLLRLLRDSVWLAKFYKAENDPNAYETERALLLMQYRQALENEIPGVLDKKAARRFIAYLDALRSLKDDEIDQMIEELVDSLCSNPAIARKGIVEMIHAAGYEWPKAYRFKG